MQAPPNLAPQSPNLSLPETEALHKVLAQGGMPELFFTSVERVVAGLIVAAIERDRLCRNDLFKRGSRV